MKRLFIIIALCLGIAVSANAQGELQFNQVRLIEVVGTGGVGQVVSISEQFNVPEGKVLKVEWARLSTSGDGGTTWSAGQEAHGAAFVDDYLLVTSINSEHSDRPMWLPSGTYEFRMAIASSNQAPARMCKARMSAIEFNVEQ